ncbi:MAG: hypothetical protein VCB24_00620 [Pseudomonas sp.]|uniref:hypothetical protein n=1 Tax=Pseudomonas sp. TaxID=306 RepID=UPI0039828881
MNDIQKSEKLPKNKVLQLELIRAIVNVTIDTAVIDAEIFMMNENDTLATEKKKNHQIKIIRRKLADKYYFLLLEEAKRFVAEKKIDLSFFVAKCYIEHINQVKIVYEQKYYGFSKAELAAFKTNFTEARKKMYHYSQLITAHPIYDECRREALKLIEKETELTREKELAEIWK